MKKINQRQFKALLKELNFLNGYLSYLPFENPIFESLLKKHNKISQIIKLNRKNII